MSSENAPLVTAEDESRPKMVLAASVISAIALPIHLFEGGAQVVVPLRAGILDGVVRGLLVATWHVTTLLLAFSAYVFYRASLPVVHVFGVFWVLCGVAILFSTVRELGLSALYLTPQSFLFLVVGLLAAKGSVRPRS